ncbi:hypothetical protein BV25DRAFT_13565 [Artomyces pyxidatus]|uniref:Uncharacterized protein n=1 Tax=Artomyces pyxidatus TaxID=48021 RepID=A0ACB8TJI6_9AGAM|nr:hypothetical protein BV25DRAFT_13565 [Artomyces pyxidatus]
MAPRRKCTVCGSRQWHKEPATGLVICSEGHILQNYRNETNETEELGPHTVRKRTLKSGRKRRARESRADPKLYHGARAQYLYFQCLQLLLRKQIAALTRAWDLPPEFELVCRDVWALHLSLLPTPPPPEPLLHQQDVDGTSGVDEFAGEELSPETTPLPEEDAHSGRDSSPERPPSSSSSADSSDDSDEPSESPEIDELLRGLSDSSESDEDELGGDAADARPKPEGSERKRGGRGAWGRQDGPASTIAVLVVACWTLRLPIMYMDFVRLIELYDLPYLDPVRHLPPDMALHLPKHISRALSPPHAPTPLLLHSLSARLARKFKASHRIQIPELNAAPMLWRVVRALGGTPVLYSLTKTVAHVLSLPLTLHYTLAPSLPQIEERDVGSHKYDNVPPELAFLAATVVVLKMVYGLDGRVRTPREGADPACALPRMHEYLTSIRDMRAQAAQSEARVFSARTDMATVDLSESMLDGYIDLCERALVGQVTEDRRVIDEYFPLPAGARRTAAEPKGEERVLPAGVPLEDGMNMLEPGRSYGIYNSRDAFGALPEEYEMMIEYGAEWAGVPTETLMGVVERYELRVVRWWERVRRRESREAAARLG